MGGDGRRRLLGGRTGVVAGRRFPAQIGGVRVEPETDLAAALFNERRSSIDETTQPLTAFFSADPAEKRGTLPPAMVILSPVRGFTP